MGINIEKSEGVASGEGLCPSQLGVWGLATRKKINFVLKKLCSSEQVLVLLSYITAIVHQRKWRDYPPVLKVGRLSPCPPPCSDAYGMELLQTSGNGINIQKVLDSD